MKSVNCTKPGYTSITYSKISNIPYNLIFTTKFNDSLILITIISCDYMNLSLVDEYVGNVTIPTKVIKYNQNFLQADQPIRLQYSNQIKLFSIKIKLIWCHEDNWNIGHLTLNNIHSIHGIFPTLILNYTFFFTHFDCSYFPLIQRKFPIACIVQWIQHISSHNLYKIFIVVTTCEFSSSDKISDFLRGSNIYTMSITTAVVSWNLYQGEVYNIMWSSLSVICDRFSLVTLVSSTNKTDRYDITEILLKVALNTIKQTYN